MDYVVGSISALITGNVTPNGPKLTRKALTPMKRQRSPNVTPKCEGLEDRSIFLSPSVQKKKALIKKSPKRIFENPDMDVTSEIDDGSNKLSPKADKVKKHLKEKLGEDLKFVPSEKKKAKSDKFNHSSNDASTSKESKIKHEETELFSNVTFDGEDSNEVLSQKKLKKNKKSSLKIGTEVEQVTSIIPKEKNKKKHIKLSLNENINNEDELDNVLLEKNKSTTEADSDKTENMNGLVDNDISVKKKKKKYKELTKNSDFHSNDECTSQHSGKKNKVKVKSNKQLVDNNTSIDKDTLQDYENKANSLEEVNQVKVNPNAITHKDSDSEHESDDELECDTEKKNEKIFKEIQSKENSENEPENKLNIPKESSERDLDEELRRTIFVGNVPLSKKCKKEIKKIFNKYGAIDSIRIRTVPVKDLGVNPKLAVIKNELHPERSTVNVYIKFADMSSVEKALQENNTVLDGHHLRVTHSDYSALDHDPKLSVFVGNLPFALEDETLRKKFEKCGEIESVRIVRDRKTNAGKGFGYVNFKSKDGVELALGLSDEDLTIKNRIIRVKRCTQVAQRKNASNKNINRNDQGSFDNRQNQNNVNRNNQGNFHSRQNQNNHASNTNLNRNNPGSFYGRHNQNNRAGNTNVNRNNQGKFINRNQTNDREQMNFGANENNSTADGAYRRIANKRKNEEVNSGGPPSKKMAEVTKREKKSRKEFVGMTAQKKKKHKVAKDQRKKKVLSEILTKYNNSTQ